MMEWHTILALGSAAPFLLVPVAFVWFLNVGGLYQAIRQAQRKKVLPVLVCSVDADCPSGYICVNGNCMSAA